MFDATLGEPVTTKSSVVALTYWQIPVSPVAAPAVTVQVVVGLKPVPVKATTVPTGAPTAMPVGEAEVMVGPATVKAFGKYELSTSTEWAPAVAPSVTVSSQVSVDPVWPPRHAAAVMPIEAPGSDAVEVPAVVSMGVVYWLKPSPVKVIAWAGAPGETAAAVERLEAVISGATDDCMPTPNAPAGVEYESPFPGDVLVTVSTQAAL